MKTMQAYDSSYLKLKGVDDKLFLEKFTPVPVIGMLFVVFGMMNNIGEESHTSIDGVFFASIKELAYFGAVISEA